MDAVIESKYGYYANLGLDSQPYIIICGPLFAISEIFIVINKVKISCGNCVLNALDICFKSFFAFGLEYSILCSHVWTFFHWYCYKVDKNKKKTIALTKSTTLFNELQIISAD